MYRFLRITIIPKTWIIAPYMSKEQVERWIQAGCVDRDYIHVDRAFPRNDECKPIIYKLWIEAPMKRACRRLGLPTEIATSWSIVDENKNEVNYAVIPDKPLIYKRSIHKLNDKGEVVKKTLEVLEYIDFTYKITFTAKVPAKHYDKFKLVLTEAGKIGLLAKTNKGYGRFKVLFEDIKPNNIPGINVIKR